MSFEAMQTGISGINATSLAMTVVGDNIANINTPGYKSSRPLFADVLIQNLGQNKQIGRGTQLAAVTRNFAQSAFQTTGTPTDMAVDGNGLFVLKGDSGFFYSRAGAFKFDKNGDLVNPAGLRVQGYEFDPTTSTFASALTTISLAGTSSQPKATGKVNVSVNADSRASVPTTAYDPLAITPNMYNHAATVTIYDSLGNPHQGQVLFRKAAAANTWDWHLAVDGGNLVGGTAGVLQEAGAGGQITFTSGGLLDTESGGLLSVDFTGGAGAAQSVDIDFGSSITTDGGAGTDGTTQYAVDSSTVFMAQDGFGPGALQEVSVARDGSLSGTFTNGRIETLSRLALASFADAQSLGQRGNTLFAETLESGPALIDMAATGKLGNIASNALESANVDLATQFVNMVNLQRTFQANARTVTTSSQLIAEIINLGT